MTTIALHDYLQQIEDLVEEHRLAEAVDHCRHILRQHPQHIPTYRSLAKVFIEKGEYENAVDLLNRVLSVDPNDFITHVALSIAYKELADIPRSNYHLHRALDSEPYNTALWDELQDLHTLNKTVPPESTVPSPTALARLYLKSEMYAAAVAELRQLLAQSPDRIDLKVQLADAVWWSNQRVEAVSLALEILDVLPNCLSANAILAEIWLQTGRKAEAQTYLKRLQAMTLLDKQHLEPETAVGRAFLVRGAPPVPDSVTVDYYQDGGAQPVDDSPLGTVDSDWISEFSLEDTGELAESQELEGDTDWLSAAAVAGDEALDTTSSAAPSESSQVETEWFVDPATPDDESLDELLGDVGDDAQLEDWLSDLTDDGAEEVAEPGASSATGFTGFLGELAETDDAAETAVPDSTEWDTVSGETEEAFAEGLTELFEQIDDVEETAVEPEAAFGDDQDDLMAADLAALTEPDEEDEEAEHTGYTQLFDQLSTDAFPEEPTALDSDWLSPTTDSLAFDESDEEPAEDTPDWLADVKKDEFEPVQIDNRLTSDWLAAPEEPVDDEEDAVESDWLAGLAGEASEAAVEDKGKAV
ncbi:MAG: tetratricopeptide repeat protein [Anaerolineae bacterium]